MKAIYKISTATFNIFCVFYFAFVLVISINAAESIKPNSNEECSNNSANKCVLISIIGSSEILKKNKTSLITIQIENTSYKPFPLKFYSVIVLKQKENNRKETSETNIYKSIAYLDSTSPFNLKKILWEGEKIQFNVDLADLGWFEGDDLFTPTDANLSEFIPLGEYKLYSEMISTKFENDEINGRIESKHLDISIF